jgi:hypothetical protein
VDARATDTIENPPMASQNVARRLAPPVPLLPADGPPGSAWPTCRWQRALEVGSGCRIFQTLGRAEHVRTGVDEAG